MNEELWSQCSDDPSVFLEDLSERIAVAEKYLAFCGWNTRLSFAPAAKTLIDHIDELNGYQFIDMVEDEDSDEDED